MLASTVQSLGIYFSPGTYIICVLCYQFCMQLLMNVGKGRLELASRAAGSL